MAMRTPAQIRKIAVLRALQLGDLLCAVPALRALRHWAPSAEIQFIGLPGTAQLIKRYSCYLDRFIAFPGFPGLVEQEPDIVRLPEFLREMQRQEYDLVIQLHGSGTTTNVLIELFAAKAMAGFAGPRAHQPRGCFITLDESEHEVLRCLRLVAELGADPRDSTLEFPLSDDDYYEFGRIAALRAARGYVCLHAGSRSGSRWPVEAFAAVGQTLLGAGYGIVLTGTAEEQELNRNLAARLGAGVCDLSGKTSLGALGVVLERSSLLVCNDTGVSHMAAALFVPSVVIFSESDPARWAPLNAERHRRILPGKRSPAEVIAQAMQLLREAPRYAA